LDLRYVKSSFTEKVRSVNAFSLLRSGRLFSGSTGSLKTPLYDLHVSQGGQIVDFAGTFS